MPIDTNLNVSPFYDDFDETKNFHRVLFRPSVAVQARELTQLQTILQNQIERFGDNIYTVGTIIQGCSLTTDYSYYYIKIRDNQADGQQVNMPGYSNTLIVDTSSNLQAVVVNFKTGLESQDPDLNTLFVKYLNTGSSGEKSFSNNQLLTIYDRDRKLEAVEVINGGTSYSNSDTVVISGGGGSGAAASLTTFANGTINQITITNKGTGFTSNPTISITTSTGSSASFSPRIYIAQVTSANSSFTSPIGVGSAVKTSEGIIYQKGHFVRVDPQEEILSKYSVSPSNVAVGFTVSESIVNNNLDTTLLDNATGSSNFAAPGAFRLKLTPTLTVVDRETAKANTTFLSLLEFEGGNIVKDRTQTQFNSIRDELSQRTLEESGNYTVTQFPISTTSIAGNNTHFNINIGAGLAYVGGNRIELLNNVKIPVRKGTDTSNSSLQTVATTYGNYVLIEEMLGVFDIKTGATVTLRSVAGDDVSDNPGGSPSLPGLQIGTAKVRSLEYDSGIPGSPSCRYKLFLFDVRLSKGVSFKSVRSVAISGAGVADVVLENQEAKLQDFDNDVLIFNSGTSAVKEFNNETYIFRTSSNGTILTTGNVSFSFSGGNTLPYGNSSDLSDTLKEEFIVIPTQTIVSSTNKSGTIDVANGTSTNAVGTSTSFNSDYEVGDYIKIGTKNPARIVRIFNDALMELSSAVGSASSNTHTISYPANVPIDYKKRNKVIAVTSNTGLTLSLGHSTTATASVVVYHDMQNFEPSVKQKTLNNPIYVKISNTSLRDSLTGPWCLGIPDVLRITGVYIGSGGSYSNTSTTNYVNEFVLDNGQRDNYYGLSFLSKKPGSSVPLSRDSTLLVELECFTHSSGLYISTESYPVDDSSPPASNTITTQLIPLYISSVDGESYSLQDCLDFRPIVANTATLSTTIGSATVDPSVTETLVAGEKFFPSPSKSFRASVESYLYRLDRLVINSQGDIRVIEGIPSNDPSIPAGEKGSMDIGYIRVAPFPSLSEKEARDFKRPDLSNYVSLNQTRRYTMRDIGSIESRLRQLEYYVSLNSLESDTKNLTLASEANTEVERFKNGFFVDPFSNYDISNLNDFEYKARIDTATSRLTSLQEVNDINLKYNSGGQKSNDLITLPFTTSLLVEQPFANKERTLVDELYSYRGNMLVVPNFDNFFDADVTATSSINVDIATPIESLARSVNDALKLLTVGSEIIGSNTEVVEEWRSGRTIFTNNAVTTFTSDTKVNLTIPSSKTNEQEVGSFLTNITLNPYIRAQKIAIFISGLRPGATHYVFAEGLDLTSNCAPAELTATSNISLDSFRQTGPTGTSLVANSSGCVASFVYIPSDTFTAGEVNILVMDVSNLASEPSATSKAVGKFSAFNFSGDKTRVTFSTKTFEISPQNNFSALTYTVPNQSTEFVLTSRRHDPLSQTFRVQPVVQSSETVFLTRIDVYFKQKDSNKGVQLELREVDSGGFPTTLVIPFSKVYKLSSEVNVSNNASVATSFIFDSPVAVTANRDYAIVLYPDGNSPEYRIWSGQTGLPDVANTSSVVNESWGLGTLFYSVSGSAFTPVQNEDIKFRAYYADFDVSSNTVNLTNADQEFLTVSNSVNSFIGGEDVSQLSLSYINSVLTTNASSRVISTSTDLSSTLNNSDYITVIYDNDRTSVANVSISGTTVSNSTSVDFTTLFTNGDFVKFGNSTVKEVRQIISVTNATSMEIDATTFATMTNHEIFTISPKFDILRVTSANSTTITVDKPPSLSSNSTSTVSSSFQKSLYGVVTLFNGSSGKLHVKNSNAANSNFKFLTSNSTYRATIVGSESGARTKVDSINDIELAAFRPLINYLILKGTSITARGTFTKSLGGTYSQDINLLRDNTFDINDDVVVKSKSNEISGATLTKSLSIDITLTSGADDMSPVIDINPSSIIGLSYLINNDSSNENTKFGSAAARYISKNLVLSEGLDAEDVKLFLTAFKPVGTEIKVYAKILNGTDGEVLDDKDWSELDLTSASVFSSSLDRNDLREYEYTFKKSPPSYALPGSVTSSSNSTIEGSNTQFIISFNSNTDVNDNTNFISISNNLYNSNDIITYIVASGNTPLTNLNSPFGVEINTVSVNEAGSGYTNGDVVVISGSNSFSSFVVTTGASDTNVASLAISSRGLFSTAPSTSNVSTTTQSGGGTGLTVDVTTRTLHGPFYSVQSNSSGTQLSLTQGGSAISLEKGSTETGHFLSVLNSRDIVKVVKTDTLNDYEIFPVSAVIDANTVILSGSVSHNTSGMILEKVTLPKQAFKYCSSPVGNNVVRYFDNNLSAFDTYKILCVKVVLLSETNYVVPQLKDLRAIAVSV